MKNITKFSFDISRLILSLYIFLIQKDKYGYKSKMFIHFKGFCQSCHHRNINLSLNFYMHEIHSN